MNFLFPRHHTQHILSRFAPLIHDQFVLSPCDDSFRTKERESKTSETLRWWFSLIQRMPPKERGRSSQSPAVPAAAVSVDTTELAKTIATQLSELRYECANCLEIVRHEHSTWNCSSCFRVFHLACIKKWAKVEESGEGRSFRCPHCQAPQKPVSRYRCFCQKQQDPRVDPMLSCPHSCGATCGRKRGVGCPHPCPSQCHPGPCPECPLMVSAKRCPCGKTTYTYRCGKPDPRTTCENICGKKLSCGSHRCELPCHHGPCQPCGKPQQTPCVCGKVVKDLSCGSKAFHCEHPCDKPQRCGRHKCDVVCHSGTCPPCNRDPSIVVTCPCGKQPLKTTRALCTDPISVCEEVCGKVLSCGRHNCEKPCHDSPCESCNNRSTMKCPCKSTMATVYCKDADEFHCQKKCKTKLQCGKHECERICCPDRGALQSASSHLCEKTCGKKLPCSHVCMEKCHRGVCPACPDIIVTPLSCYCGVEMIMPPLPCGTQPPVCRLTCTKTRDCGHPSDDHNCHHGDCPPCSKPVSRMCAGEHKTVGNVLCSAAYACCTDVCGKPLECGHVCGRMCHGGACVTADRPCTQTCGKMLPCGHPCLCRCHPGNPNCGKCATVVEMSCDCGVQQLKMPCAVFLKRLEEHRQKSEVGRPFIVECNNDCLYESRLSILKARSRKADDRASKCVYSPKLWAAATKSLDVVLAVEERLCAFITSRDLSLMLPPMQIEKRAIVHELCFYFHIQSESHDKEPNRTVLLTKNIRSAVPNPLLSVAIKSPANDPNEYATSVLRRSEEAMKRIIVFEGSEQRMTAVDVNRCLGQFAGDFVTIDPLADGSSKLLDDGFSAQTQMSKTGMSSERIRVLYAIFLPHRIKPAYESLRHRGCPLLFRLLGFPYPPRQFAWEPSRPALTTPKMSVAAVQAPAAVPVEQHVDPSEHPPAAPAASGPKSWSSLVTQRTNAKTRKQQETKSVEVVNSFAALSRR